MAEENRKEEEQLLEEPVPIKDIMIMTILSLEGKAWAYLGLVAHPETKKIKKDLNEAKLAIDSIDVLFKLMEPLLTNEEKKDIQTRLTNLRLNFVKT
ncbi:MAG: DUF1844 domain-containing protein [bacterium]